MSERHRRGIGRNTIVLVLGSMVQVTIAFVTVPLYLSVIGEERYGAWILVAVVGGYFLLLDRGVSAAIQNDVARLGDNPSARSTTVWTGVVINLLVGVFGGAAYFCLGWFLFSWVISLPAELHLESLAMLPVAALALPISAVTSVFQSAIGGRERFLVFTIVETLRLSALQLLPLGFAYWWGPELIWIAIGGLVAVLLGAALTFVACLHVALAPVRWSKPSRTVALRVFHYGKWFTVTSILAPFFDTADRVILGTLRGPSAVTAFTIPYNAAQRLLVIPFNLVRVMFPRLSAVDSDESRTLGASALRGLAAITLPISVLASTVSGPFFIWWIGDDLAETAAPVAAVLFAGAWIQGLGFIPVTLLQAQGRPDLPARVNVIELGPFLLLLALGVYVAGPIGAAVVWVLRIFVACMVLLIVSGLPWFRDPKLLAGVALVLVAAVNGAVLASETELLMIIGAPLIALSFVAAWILAPSPFRWGAFRSRRTRLDA